MSYTIGDLINDLLPRVGKLENKGGITIWSAANSVLSLLTNVLLDKKSDLLATGHLFLIIPAYDYRVPLPSDFIALAEKPKAVEAPSWLTSTPWMAGTVTTYDAGTKTLVLNVTSINGSGTISSWHVAIGWFPGQPIYTIDTSVSPVLVGTGAKTFITATALSLVPGQNVIVSNETLPTDQSTISRLQPEYLDDDEHEDFQWWDSENRFYGETYETASTKPRKYKILGTTLYVRPKVTGPILISGLYHARPTAFTLPTQVIPWNGMFDEIFREGTIRIISKGIAIPEADDDFMIFFNRAFGMVLYGRTRLIPDTGRTKRANFM